PSLIVIAVSTADTAGAWRRALPSLLRPRPLLHQRRDPRAERLGPERAAEISRAPVRRGDRAIERVFDRRGRAREAPVVAAVAPPGGQQRRRARVCRAALRTVRAAAGGSGGRRPGWRGPAPRCRGRSRAAPAPSHAPCRH